MILKQLRCFIINICVNLRQNFSGLSRLGISGSGNIDVAVDAPEVDVDISGSGNIKLRTFTQKLSSNISGSGDVFLIGESVGPAWFNTSGSGDIRAFDFESKYCSVNTAGSGNVINAN